MQPSPPEKPGYPVAKLLGMFLLILGAKFWTLQMCSAPLPLYDQWEAEGTRLLQPWLHGTLRLADLFAPWVQHRILWTRLLVLGAFALNGQWDTQVQAIAAAVIHALVAVGLGAILVRRLGRAWEDAVLLGLLAVFALPIGLENTLSGGFQSQYYLLLLFAVVTVWGLGSHRPGAVGWWAGVLGAVAAWFSVATGGLPSLAVAAWMGLRLLRRDGVARENGITLAVALFLGQAGLALSFVGVDTRGELRPHSVSELMARFLGLLGWPLPTAWAAPLIYAPFAWLVWRTVRTRRPTGPAEAFLLPLGFFTLLNTAALAYARNHYFGLYVSRYMDLLSFGTLVNFACLLLFLRETTAEGNPSRARLPFGVLAVVWTVCAGYGLVHLTARGLADTLPFTKICSQHEIGNMAALVARPEAQRLASQSVSITFCDNPPIANALLKDPAMLRVMPAAVRAPVILEAAAASAGVRLVKPRADDDLASVWTLAASPGQPAHFRSQVVRGPHAPYLRFPEVSGLGEDAFIALVDETSGATTWLQPTTDHDGHPSALARTPSGPFHVEAVVAAGASHPLTFAYPREVGGLSAWVETVFGSAAWLLTAGGGLWLGVVFWRRLGLHELGLAVRFGPVRVPAWNWRNRRMTIRHG